jgi:hypothetical protein
VFCHAGYRRLLLRAEGQIGPQRQTPEGFIKNILNFWI